MNYFCDIGLQQLYINDRSTKSFVLQCYPPFIMDNTQMGDNIAIQIYSNRPFIILIVDNG